MVAFGPRGFAEAPRLDHVVVEPGSHDVHSPSAAGWPGVPAPPSGLLSRPRLLDRMDTEPRCRLVLVRAPAGSGKTALVADWVRHRAGGAVEWVSFEPGDPFWPGLLGALERLGLPTTSPDGPGSGAPDADTHQSLARAVARSTEPLTVVLDGPELRSRQLATDVDMLLRHTGRRLRLALIARDEPALPLYRYRLEDTVVELGPADLAFTDLETHDLLLRMGTRAPTDVLRALRRRVAGWAAGLRYAGIALAAGGDPHMALARASGDDGDMTEYLRSEVLAGHPRYERELLMSMSVPAILPPGLVSLLGGPAAGRALARLARSNAFVEPVPGHIGQHQIAPFFRAFLQRELAQRSPTRLAQLHRLTADWFVGHDYMPQLLPRLDEPSAARSAGPAADELSLHHQASEELLTRREVEVLEHVAGLLSTSEIADAMFISVNTVRTHVRHILRKLDVERRNAAVRVARDRGLLNGPIS